jgi:PAS domain S-box-containing protein
MRRRLTPSGVALLYGIIAAAWIVASSYLLTSRFDDPLIQTRIEMVRGLAFVVVSSGLLYVLLRAWRESFSASAAEPQPLRPPEIARLAGLIAALALVVPLLGVAIVKLHGPQVEREAFANLDAVATLKAQQIENWLAERQDDAQGLLTRHELVLRLGQLKQQGRSADFSNLLVERIGPLRSPDGYDEILFLDGAGRLVTALPAGAEASLSPALWKQALSTGKVQRSDPYRDASGHTHLDWVVPLMLPAPHDDVAVLVVLRTDFAKFLHRMIETWPSVSASAETVLVRPIGDGNIDVIFSPQRSGKDLGAQPARPGRLLPAAISASVATPATLQDHDYRGQAVLAAVRPVSGVDWRIVTKIDRAELMAPLWDLMLWVGLVGFAAVVAITAALLMLWRQQQRAERHASLAEKAKAERLLQKFFHMPFIGIARASPTTRRWTEFNDRLCEILGYSRSELAELDWTDLTDPDDLPAELAEFDRVLRGEADGYAMDKRFIRRDGGVVFASIDVRGVRRGDGSVAYLIAAVQDISERKQTQLQLEANKEELEEKVRQRTESLEKALLAARRAEQAKDEFLANVSHELRTPLTVVIGLADLALRYDMPARPRDHLEKVAQAGRTLSSLINDLLDLSKIAAGRMELDVALISPREIVERTLAIIEQQAKAKNLELTVQIDPGVESLVFGDALRVEQVLLNLLSNAIKFTERGGISLQLSSTPLGADRVRFDFAVADSGIGIHAGELEGLFQPFAQADASVARRFGGTGLGLALCKRLVELMGGEIGVSSQAGSGSRFSFYLVFGRASGADAAPPPGAGFASLPALGGRVLVVDDQPINREIVRELLEAIAVEVDEATDGAEALHALAQRPRGHFDLVLMDVQMPVMDGLAATRLLRLQPEHAALPIVAMTAHTMEHEREKSRAAGMNDHIGKPFDRTTFYLAMGRWLGRCKLPAPTAAGACAGEAACGTAVPEAGASFDVINDVEGIDCQGALARFGGNADRYRHWLRLFIGNSQRFSQQMEELLADGMSEQARVCAHSFKSEVGMLGMSELHAVVGALETAIAERTAVAPLLADCRAATTAMRDRLLVVLQVEQA